MPDIWRVKAKQGNSIHPSMPKAAVQYVRTEMTRYAALAKRTGISLD